MHTVDAPASRCKCENKPSKPYLPVASGCNKTINPLTSARGQMSEEHNEIHPPPPSKQKRFEPRKTPFSLSIESCLLHRDPYNGFVTKSPYHWVLGSIIPNICSDFLRRMLAKENGELGVRNILKTTRVFFSWPMGHAFKVPRKNTASPCCKGTWSDPSLPNAW